MLEEMFELFGSMFLLFFVVFFSIFGMISGYTYLFGEKKCSTFATQAGLKYDWAFWGTCMLTLPDGSKIPVTEYRKNLSYDYKVNIK